MNKTTMTTERMLERGIDTLQRLYAVIIALAVGEGLKRTFLETATNDRHLDASTILLLVAFVVTVVPFIHGMNRHMDNLISGETISTRRIVFLVLDFGAFLGESCLLLLIAISITDARLFITLLIWLLAFDVIWAVMTWCLTGGVVVRWAAINIVAIVLLTLTMYLPSSEFTIVAITAGLAVLRTVADYLLCHNFYFPISQPGPVSS